MADIELTCKDCGNSFVWTEGEQEFFKQRDFSTPVRCPSCRLKKKQQKEQRPPRRY